MPVCDSRWALELTKCDQADAHTGRAARPWDVERSGTLAGLLKRVFDFRVNFAFLLALARCPKSRVTSIRPAEVDTWPFFCDLSLSLFGATHAYYTLGPHQTMVGGLEVG